MNRTTIDPTLVARLSAQFAALGAHMSQVGGDLDLLRGQLQEVDGGLASEAAISRHAGQPGARPVTGFDPIAREAESSESDPPSGVSSDSESAAEALPEPSHKGSPGQSDRAVPGSAASQDAAAPNMVGELGIGQQPVGLHAAESVGPQGENQGWAGSAGSRGSATRPRNPEAVMKCKVASRGMYLSTADA